jgi:hypothetical protein
MAKLDGQPVPAATLLAPHLTVRASTRAANLMAMHRTVGS